MLLVRFSFVLLSLLGLANVMVSQSEDFGPFAVVAEEPRSYGLAPKRGERPKLLRRAKRLGQDVRGQIVRPANPDAKTPLPVVVFLHGFSGQPLGYGVELYHLASWGFYCVAVQDVTEPDRQNPYTQAMLAWSLVEAIVEDEARQGRLVLRDEGWGVVGHSMGAVGAFYLAGADPRIQSIVSISPYEGTTVQPVGGSCTEVQNGLSGGWEGAVEVLSGYSGRVHLMAGTDDQLTPAAAAQFWFDQAANADLRRLAIVEGLGHVAPLDHALNDSPLVVPICEAVVPVGAIIGPDQHRLVRRFVGASLRIDLLGESQLVGEIIEPSFGGSEVTVRKVGSSLVKVDLIESR